MNQCIQCHKACKLCTQPNSDLHCVECTASHYHWTQTSICKLYCPSGFSAHAGECLYNGSVFKFTLDKMKSTYTSSDVIAAVYNYMPIYKRGYYFQENSYLSVENLILANSFNTRFWIHGTGKVLEIHNDHESQLISVSAEDSLSVKYSKGDTLFQASSGDVEYESWRLVTLLMIWISAEETEIQMFQNTALQIHTYMDASFIDSPYNKHLSYLQGFVYQLEFDQTVELDFTKYIGSPCGTIYCTVCPADACLLDCDWNYYEGIECSKCKDSCTQGCVRWNNCSGCHDNECLECDSFDEDATCHTCIKNASHNSTG